MNYSLTEKNHYEQLMDAKSGDTIEVTLRETPSVGYQWYITSAIPLHLKLISNEFQNDSAAGYGFTGFRKWKFEIVEKGRFFIEMKYFRLFEGENRHISIYKFGGFSK